MGKSFSDIIGGDIEGQIKLNRGEKPELPPKTAKAEEGEQSPSNVEEGSVMAKERSVYDIQDGYDTLSFVLDFNIASSNIATPEQIAEYFGNPIFEFIQDSIDRNLISKKYHLERLLITHIICDEVEGEKLWFPLKNEYFFHNKGDA